ncbi:hypothetical protein KKF11_00445 [Patescibacteria group bacterium]|nr:hypothetical protein [Patescibacteria group bacterium]
MEEIKVLPIALSKVETRVVFSGLALIAFAVPFSLGDSQFVTGTLVNAALIFSALALPKKFFVPMIVFPSLGVLSRGFLFGPLTPFLFYFLPFIWVGNLLLITAFKRTLAHFSFSFFHAVLIAGLLKFAFLAICAKIFFGFGIIPRLFLTAMGINQLITALLGGALSFLLFSLYKQKNFERR